MRAKFRTWLFRIARNLIVHALAARQRNPQGTGDSDFRALFEEQPTPDSEDSRLFDQEYRRQLLAWAADRVRGQFHETTWQAFWLTSVDGQGTTITALMQDPESVPPLERKPNELRQWDVATGKLRWSERVAGAGWVAGTADGKALATAIGREVQLRDAATGQVTRRWTTDEHLSPLAFSPDGHLLAASDCNGTVTLWNVATGERRQTITDHRAGVSSAVVAPDGATLATGSEDKTLRLSKLPAELIRLLPKNRPGI
ncbi:MAG TPA: hypothetical protein VJL29_13445 [Thermoguttaceae bacterium]|nr:hypothetical protein [Thermoguttaceae bacterium]